MFRKYYHQANDDIKADEELINRVINNVKYPHRKRVFRRYAASTAAAVIVISAAAVCVPYLKHDTPDGGVIETVQETAFPETTPYIAQTAAPQLQTAAETPKPNINEAKNTADTSYNSNVSNESENKSYTPKTQDSTSETSSQNSGDYSDSTKPDEENTSIHSYKVFSAAEMPEEKSSSKSVTSEAEGEAFKSSAAVSVINENSDFEEEAADTSGVAADTSDEAAKTEADESTENQPVLYSSVSSCEERQAGGGAADIDLQPPAGYYVSSKGSGFTVLESEGGGVIYVYYSQTSDADTEPVYSQSGSTVSVQFVRNGKSYSITAENADMEIVSQLVSNI